MSIDIVSVLLIIANVLVLYFVLNKLLYKPVAKFIGKREEAIGRARDQINRGKTAETDAKAVSYTHLDVYKRQIPIQRSSA